MERAVIQGYRLSPQQERLWLRQAGQASPFRARLLLSIKGDLDVARVEVAIRRVIQQNEILRTSFRSLPSMKMPLQVISEESGLFSVELAQLNEVEPARQQAVIRAALDMGDAEPFDLAGLFLLRAQLFTLSAGENLLAITLPALCADSASLENLAGRICRAYAAGRGDLPDEPVQYADVSEWQREALLSEAANLGQDYWRRLDYAQLSNMALPGELRPTGPQPFSPSFVTTDIEPVTARSISDLSARLNLPVLVLLLACWQALIYRISRRSRMIFGVCFDGRIYAELQEPLGLFARYLPVQVELQGDLAFIDFVEDLDHLIEECGAMQEYFSPPNLAASGENPLPVFFPVGFEFQPQPQARFAGAVAFRAVERQACVEPFKIKLTCAQESESLTAWFQYDPAVFYEADIRRLAAQFHVLLRDVVRNPSARLDSLRIISDGELRRLLVDFNNARLRWPDDHPAHLLFERQAELSPDRVAVRYEDHSLSYRDLNAQANRLAHYLRERGVGPDARVAIGIERSLEVIVAMLAALKAGGAYVPLDMNLPKLRIASMLRDAEVAVTLTQRHLAGLLPEGPQTVICLDVDWREIGRLSEGNPASLAHSANLAYVLFTSGSTGQPKGVAIGHAQLSNYVRAILAVLDVAEDTSFALISTFSADLGNTMIFPALCSGGLLHIISQERAYDPKALAAYFSRHRIDCLKIVPSHLNALLSGYEQELILPKQRLVLGGEAVRRDWVKQLTGRGGCSIINHYGPTETTVGVLTYKVDGEALDERCKSVPVGRPIANTQAYLLDERLQPAPIYAAGELYIGGLNLARGYLRRPEQTAERFVPDHLSGGSGERLYWTGDVGRRLAGGEIEFLGRVDHQVKLRGFRIELAEIETALKEYPGVQDAVVIVKEGSLNDSHLVAYVVGIGRSPIRTGRRNGAPDAITSGGRAPTAADLQLHLRERLADYMLPSAFVFLDRLPLTPNGKIDRQALPAPENLRETRQSAFTPPRTIAERKIAAVWRSLLAIESVGIKDNFFDLGGNSLLMIQAHGKLCEALGKDLLVLDLFRYPTIEALSEYLSQDETQLSSASSNEEMASRVQAGKSRLLRQLKRGRQALRGNDE